MTVLNLRWGYESMGCVPYEGAYVVELTLLDEDGRLVFLSDLRFDVAEQIIASPVPLIDLQLQLQNDVDDDYETDVIDRIALEKYEFDREEPDPALKRSRFAQALPLLRRAMERCLETEVLSEQNALAWIAPYLDRNLEEDR